MEIDALSIHVNLELLLSVLALLRPARVIFFDDLTFFDHALDFVHDQRTDAH